MASFDEYLEQYLNNKKKKKNEPEKTVKNQVSSVAPLSNDIAPVKEAPTLDVIRRAAQTKSNSSSLVGALEEKYNKATEFSKRVKEIENQINTSKKYSGRNGWVYGKEAEKKDRERLAKATAEYNAYLKEIGYKNLDELKGAYTETKAYYNRSKYESEGAKLAEVTGAKDFAQLTGKGLATDIEFGVRSYVRLKRTRRETIDKYYAAKMALDEHYGNVEEDTNKFEEEVSLYRNMTDEEFKIFEYHLIKDAKNGTSNAKEYIDKIEQNLEIRKAEQNYDADKSNIGKVGYSIPQGLDQFATGLRNAINMTSDDEYIPVNATQLLGQQYRTELGEEGAKLPDWLGGGSAWQMAYDIGSTTSNMAPSIILSAASNALLPGSGAVVGASFMGASAMGNSYQEMLNLGYDKGQAQTYATLVGVSEAGLSYAFGGISKLGGKITGKSISKAVSGIKNGLLRYSVKLGMNALSEGFEEAAQEALAPVFENIALGYEKNTLEDTDWEEVAYAALLGGITGGVIEGTTGGKTNALTKSEQAVFDKLYDDAIAEKEKDGTKLTSKQKTDIYNDILENMEKGNISIDTIEEVLGGETYSNYKSALEQEENLQKEFDTLNKMKQLDMTGEQIDRRAELKQQLEELKNNSNSAQLKAQLKEEVYGLAKDSRLAESYNEETRKTQAFKADLTQYNEKQRKAVERAINSGVLNNTNKSHALVNTISKIEAEKGIVFDYTNNEKLKKSGFAIEGKTVNGFVQNGNVTLNVQSSKTWQSVVGHEITHVLEGTDAYSELQRVLFEVAESKGELESRRAELTELYKNMDADIDAELTADLVGDYLFGNKDFINKLTGNKRTFRAVYNEIKYLCKVATGKQLTEIEKVRQEFDKAWKELSDKGIDTVVENAKADGKTKLSMSGEKSQTADTSLLAKAEQSLEAGVDSETVRQETGWFKSYDGKWRFEIDDSAFKFHPDGQFTNPDVLRYRELQKKFVNGDITENEFNEMHSLTKTLKGVRITPDRLSDIVEHKELFEAYPQLKDIKVKYNTLTKDIRGYYSYADKEIVLNNSLIGDNETIKTTLIHEIQHAIQDIEGFSSGASVEYWKSQRQDIVDTISGARANLDLWLNDIGYDNFVKSSMQEVVAKEKTLEQHWEDCKQFKANSKYAKQIAACEAELAEYQQQYDEITNGMTAYEQYRNTAGEIEARDTENRLNLNAEERKNTRPDIDNPNAIVIGTSNNTKNFAYIGDTKDGRRCYQSGFDNEVSADKRIEEFKKRIATIFNLGAVELKTDVKKIQIKGDAFTAQKNIFGDKNAQPYELEAKINSLYDLADILATSQYDQSATKKEASYENPTVKPKNAAHKGVKYWYKFRNEIVFDGVPYTVTFSIRDKGSEQYQYFIDFKENKTSGLSNTAVNNLLRADQMSYDDSIAPIPQNVNRQYLLSETNDATSDTKQKQLEIINKTNIAPDAYHTWIRSVDDIKTLSETLEDNDWADYEEFNPDLTREDILNAIESGKITVYSSYPIKNGAFVSPSRMEAESYSADGTVYEKTVDIGNVAWIDPTQGMYAEVTDNTRFSVSKNIEKFDNSLYNEIELPIAEQKRVQSEALTWNANKRNQIITQTLSNGITYRYAIDDEGIVHIYGKEKSVNIHDWKEDYGNTNTTRPDSITEELWLGYGNGSRDSSFSQDGRKPSKDDTNDNRFVSGKGRSNGTGYSKNRTNANRKPKRWHFNEDGSVEITYNDGTKEIGNDSQINETKAGLNGSASFMPDDIAPVRRSLSNTDERYTTVGTPLKDLAFEQDIAPVRDDVNYQNQGTNVSQDFPVVNRESENSDIHNPSQDDIAPIREDLAKNKTARADKGDGVVNERIAKVLTEVPKATKEKSDTLSSAVRNFVSKGAEIENIALEKGNRELQAKYSAIRRAEAKAQYFMENGAEGVKPLKEIIAEVEKTGQTGEFFDYLYHKHNVDRMSLESKEQPNLKRLEGEMKKLKLLHLQENQLRAIASEKITKETSPKRVNLLKTVREYLASKDVKNKPVFGYFVTAEISQETANQYEANNPKFKEYAKDIYNLMNYLRSELVENGVISQKTADLWAKVYPYYVPIHRVDANGAAVNVALDTNKTGINAPIKRATGGNSDILPLFNTIGERVIQTYKAIAKNQFGIELKNTLGTVAETSNTNLDDIIDSIDTQDNLLQEGKNGQNPTFTIFENGEKVTFDINEGIYEALKPTSKGLSKTYKFPNKASELHKKVLTQYNLFFTARNFPKDAQSVMINSQHPIKTYANFPSAFKQLLTNGEYATEYFKNGGKSLTYFDKNKNEFVKEKNTFKKVLGFAPDKISDINDFVEAIPRLAEYMASRKSGKTIDGALLDASRVTTDFSDGGDITKFLNRNGFTFLNASVQGAAQQVRNIREAKANGFKGIMKLVGKYAVAGIPALLFNAMMWDDDEEYEELSDYVKDNYYIVAKYGDGQFVRIPKGREAAVIQELFEQIGNTVTGEETDWGNVFTLAASNLAPNNPLENNVVAPIIQAINNKTWYDDDLVPTRLQDLPADEQYDETIDSISKWLGENTGISPYKINYVLNQYSGFIGDMILPNLTPEAEKGDNSLLGNMIAPLIDQFTVDGTMKNQNVSDFYEKVDELTTNAKSSKATDEDKLKYKYFNSISTEVGELYNEKREIQGSDLSDKLKYKQVRDIQKQINELTENALNTYEDVKIDGKYANIGDRHYYLNKDNEWQKITDEQLEKQNKAINILGITAGQYWGNKSEYDMAAFYPEKYAVLKEQGISASEYKEKYEETAFMYTDDFSWAANNPNKYTLSKVVTDDVAEYKKFTTDLYNIKADKDSSGKTISGSRKEKVEDYINNLDIGYGAKIILFKCEYPSDETYDYDIIKYLKGREDISYAEKKTILEELGFKVDENGNIFRK